MSGGTRSNGVLEALIDLRRDFDASTTSADNGLTENPASNFQLGGALTQNTTIGAPLSGFDLEVNAADIVLDADADFKLIPGGAPAIGEVLTATAVDGTATWQAAAAAPTADNGLTENPPGNLQLGGALTASTTVGTAASGFDLSLLADDITIDADADLVLVGTSNFKLTAGGAPTVGDVLTATNVDGTATWQTAPLEPSYGELTMNPGSPGTTFTIVTAGTPIQWTGTTDGSLAGAGLVTSAADSLVIGADGAGLYKVDWACSFDGTNNATFTHSLRINAAIVTDVEMVRKLGTGGDVGNGGFTGLVSLAATDTIDVMFDAGSDGNAMAVWHANFNITRIGP